MRSVAMRINTENCLETFERVADSLTGNDPSWLSERRERALDSIRAIGFPTKSHEDWKYTDVRPLVSREYAFADPAQPAEDGKSSLNAVSVVENLDACRLVVINGRFSAALSDIDKVPEGVIVTGLADGIVSNADEFESLLGTALPEERHGFSALNDAFVNDGVRVRVAAGVAVARPLEIVFVVSAGDLAPLVQPRNLVVLEEGAELTVIERFSCADDSPYLDNVVTEVFLGPRAQLELTRIQEEGPRSGHIGGLFVRQRAESRCTVNTVSLDGMIIRNDLRVSLDEPGAECLLNGLALGDKRQHVDNHTQVDHNAERCVSREFYKSVLDDRARSVFHGRIVVKPGAQRTDSEQQNQNLLLSRDAEVDTKPQLEIYADDVKCSHGATVGQLDEDAVFYLRSRGIDDKAARGLLTIAFADSAIAGIADAALRGYIDSRIRQKLDAGN
ncbi:MAG: Fe-S cluster assembly protein SufD [Proteobacteria bacterium]|nr:MAG: Fe-S cluster assembly protein SufD [Pseudomonadota bacterium]